MKTDYLMYCEESGPLKGWYFDLGGDLLGRDEALSPVRNFAGDYNREGVWGPYATESEAIAERAHLVCQFESEKSM